MATLLSTETDSFPHPRRHTRHNFDGGLIFKPQFGTNSEAHVRDVSEGGAFIVTTNRLNVGTRLTIYMPLLIERKSKLLIIAAKVVRVADVIREKPGFGVEFDSNLSVTTKKVLSAWLAHQTAG